MEKQETVEAWVVQWFSGHTSFEGQDREEIKDENYLDAGWIDSLTFISFIDDIEKHFKIRFSNEEFQDRSFSTIRGITIIIERKLEHK